MYRISPKVSLTEQCPGWIHIKGVRTAYTNYYNKMKPGEEDQWPPKYWKFQLETDSDPKVEVAFVDPRRFGRIRLVDCPGKDIRQASPLVENGPDPVVDQDLFTYQYLLDKMRSRHVPVKALLLDQAMISGIGNWVGDEVLYHAKLHPEQYCDEFSDSQIETLHNSICHVCRIACDKLGDSDQFPEEWLFNHRWGKGKKDAASALPNGEKLAFLTVGGRTSCYAPNVQKKTGHVAPGIKEEPITSTKQDKKPAKTKAPKNDTKIEPPSKKRRKGDATPVKMEEAEQDVKKTKPKANKSQEGSGATNRRRSARLSAV